jgi:putative molybdopterin biosynthesis protein
MTVYLHDIPLEEAQRRFKFALETVGLNSVLGEERIALDENALGRVVSRPVWAKISSPHYHASAMDGFALRAVDTIGAAPNQPITLVCNADQELPEVVYVDTGDPLPEWADVVIPIENVEPVAEGGEPAENPRTPFAIRMRAAVTPWQHVRPMGEDMVATQLVLPAGQILRAVDLGAVAGCGHSQIWVARKPQVAILPTGTELVSIGTPVKPGEIIEYNSLVLAAQVKAWGGDAHRFPITSDNLKAICSQINLAAADADLILVNAGSSAGSEDFSAAAIQSLGEVLVHGVAVRPGHPVILGMIVRQKKTHLHQSDLVPIIGVPGYPVSTALTGEIFVEPLLALWTGRSSDEPERIDAYLTRKITSPPGDDDYMRVVVGKVGEKVLAAPLSRGSGVITSLVRADGIVLVPRGSQGMEAGSSVQVRLYRTKRALDNTIFAIGSHDMTLDLLSQFLFTHQRRLISANVGSLGGLIALQRGEAHVAGSHLLDPQTGIYNLSYIERYLKDIPLKVVDLVGREQGLIVQKGNPKAINHLADLQQPGIVYVNRQRGAGTRVLLDYHLDQLKIESDKITGYDHEAFTHLAVAAAVASGRADCGLGITAAAHALGLDFIPLFHEKYQLIIPDKFYKDVLLSPLFEVLASSDFQREVLSMPGYNISAMGKIAAEFE